MKHHNKYLLFGIVTGLLSANAVFASDAAVLAKENGVLENTQVILLLLSGIVFTAYSFRMEREIRPVLWMGGWFCLSAILRELDVEELSVPEWVVLIGSGTGRNLIMGSGWIVLGVIGLRSLPRLSGSLRGIATSATARWFYAAGGMLVLGALSEELFGKKGMLWEEMAEFMGWLFVLIGALFSASLSKKRSP